MKRLVAFILTLAMMVVAVSAFAATNSINPDGMIGFEIEFPEAGDVGPVIFPVNELTVSNLEDYQARIDIAEAEIAKLADSTVAEYFADANGLDDAVISLNDEGLNVFEFEPVVAFDFPEGFGAVTVKMLFPTPYEVGQDVLVMIGLANVADDGTQTVNWTAFNGVGVETDSVETQGTISTTLDEATVLGVQEGIGLLAIISK